MNVVKREEFCGEKPVVRIADVPVGIVSKLIRV